MPDESFGLAKNVSRETAERFALLEAILKKWNSVINLVSPATLADLRIRHIADSIQLYRYATSRHGRWCDLGSGGGFPGLVIAILALDDARQFQITLVESDGRKAAFLAEAARQIGLEVEVIRSRIESVPPMRASVLSARALAALPALCEFASRHLDPAGMALFPKGARYEDEISAARRSWEFELDVHASETDPSGVVLELRNIRRA